MSPETQGIVTLTVELQEEVAIQLQGVPIVIAEVQYSQQTLQGHLQVYLQGQAAVLQEVLHIADRAALDQAIVHQEVRAAQAGPATQEVVAVAAEVASQEADLLVEVAPESLPVEEVAEAQVAVQADPVEAVAEEVTSQLNY